MIKGTISNRDAFLSHLATQLGRERKSNVVRPEWKKQPQWDVFRDDTQDELITILEKQCEVIHTVLIRTTMKELPEVIYKEIEKYNGQRIIIANDQRNYEFGLVDLYSKELPKDGREVRISGEQIDDYVAYIEKADVGITFSDMTLAESGTVTLLNDVDNGRLISLLPKSYIAIIPKSTIVPRMTQATQMIHQHHVAGHEVPSCISFITGPSNSADIEVNLIVGVHGPVNVTYLVVEDK